MRYNVYAYIFTMAAVTYLVRVLPLTLIRKPVKNKFIKSFLYYVPYVTLAVMTFPSVLSATLSVYSAAAALCVGIVFAWKGLDLFKVALACSAVVIISELVLV